MGEHPISQQIIALIEQNGMWYDAFEHEPVRTSEEASRIRPEYTLEQGAKSIVLRVKIKGAGKQFVMLAVPGHQKFATSKVKQALDANDLRFATESEVQELTNGIKPGGIPPFGNLFNLPMVTDASLYDVDTIIFNAGRNCSIAMRTDDYQQLVKPTIANIV